MRAGNEKLVEQDFYGLIVGDRVLVRVPTLRFPPATFILSPHSRNPVFDSVMGAWWRDIVRHAF
jgi:hypothetical protein